MKTYFPALLLLVLPYLGFSQLIIDHTCTDITAIPQTAIEQAKNTLHIAYGHTSHGSQVIDGMTGLVEFANNGGKGLSLPENIFAWNNGGTDGALDLHDKAMGGDVGYWPDWYNNTKTYLDNPDNADVNVIMWSWCGQVDDKYTQEHLWDEYLQPMSSLEQDYPDVTFVYMTGHLEYSHHENVNAANDSIRSYCLNNNKVLFDFADIESYGPDGTCYKENGNDNCNYYDANGGIAGNWAQEYQNTHTEGEDWYQCGSQHSEPLNANRKAYAAWWMYASLAGWNYTPSTTEPNSVAEIEDLAGYLYPNPAKDYVYLSFDQQTPIVSMSIFNANGMMIKNDISYQSIGNTMNIELNVQSLTEGLYYLNITTAEETRLFKFLVDK